MNIGEIGDIVAIVPQRRGIDGQQPDAIDAQIFEIVEFFGQAAEVTVAIAVAVEKART